MVTTVRVKFSAGHFTPIEPLPSEALHEDGDVILTVASAPESSRSALLETAGAASIQKPQARFGMAPKGRRSQGCRHTPNRGAHVARSVRRFSLVNFSEHIVDSVMLNKALQPAGLRFDGAVCG